MSGKRLVNYMGIGLMAGILLNACAPGEQRLPFYNTPDFTPYWMEDGTNVSKTITHRIRDFTFTNQEGKPVTRQSVDGKIHVANFFFTICPSICPKMTNHFERVQQAFRNEEDVVLLSFSVTPWIDSVARLKEFAEEHHVMPGKWHLLTGNETEIYSMARTSYFAEELPGFNKDSTEFLHTENFILVDRTGRIRGIYKGTIELDTKRLIEDIEVLLKEDQ